MFRYAAAVIASSCLLALGAAAAPYQNYTYDLNANPSSEPQAYIPVRAMTGSAYGCGEFSNPSDMAFGADGRLYISDTGNNRIVVVDADGSGVKVIGGFNNKGASETLNQPGGIFITPENILYIADTGNRRVVALNEDGSLNRMIGAPSGGDVAADFDYLPVKVAVDFAGRVFVVSRNCEQGIVQFDAHGEFLGYFGAVKTQVSVWQQFWRAIASEKQKQAMSRIVPTEYSSIDIDDEGFVYGTVSTIDTSRSFDGTMFLHKLNPMGIDVKRYDRTPPAGDIFWTKDKESGLWNISRFIDVAVQPYGLYSALDSYRGRVFTYDANGDLLYVFGGLGDTLGLFGNPAAIAVNAGHEFLVLDNKYNQVVCFKPTEYGSLINSAEKEGYQRHYEASEKLWFQALKYTAKSELVLGKIGQTYMSQGDFKTAMQYMQYADDRQNYSAAYENYRREQMQSSFGPFMTGLLVVAAAWITFRVLRRRARRRRANGKGEFRCR